MLSENTAVSGTASAARCKSSLACWPTVREPLGVRVFAGNTADPVTVADQIKLVKDQFGVEELVFVGDRGMVKSEGKQALKDASLR